MTHSQSRVHSATFILPPHTHTPPSHHGHGHRSSLLQASSVRVYIGSHPHLVKISQVFYGTTERGILYVSECACCVGGRLACVGIELKYFSYLKPPMDDLFFLQKLFCLLFRLLFCFSDHQLPLGGEKRQKKKDREAREKLFFPVNFSHFVLLNVM